MNTKLFYITILLAMLMGSCVQNKSNTPKVLLDYTSFIGTKHYSWEDTSRSDNYYGGTRKVNVQVWYPSKNPKSEGLKTPYLVFYEGLYNRLEGWDEADYKALQNIETASFIGTSIKDGPTKMPLLIFSPSLGGNLSYYTYYAEYFAKQGYIVMGINHLYESAAIVHNDSVYIGNFQFHDSLKTLKIPQEISADGYRAAMSIRQKILAEDILFSLNQLNSDKLIGHHIDDTKIAVFGHSIGGAAGIYASLLDRRIKAVVNMDGTPPTKAQNNGIDIPFLFIEDLTDYKNHQGYAKQFKRRSDFCALNRNDSWRILIKGLHHNSFVDLNYYLAENDTIATSEKANLDNIIRYMNEFFDHYLLEIEGFSISEIESDTIEIMQFPKLNR